MVAGSAGNQLTTLPIVTAPGLLAGLAPEVEESLTVSRSDLPHRPSTAARNDSASPENNSEWSIEDAAELYGVRRWGTGYFDIAENGNLSYRPPGSNGTTIEFSEILDGLRQRGLEMPVMLRLDNIVDDRLRQLHQAFRQAIADCQYQGRYRGVFPIKVNQQGHVIDEIARLGEAWGHGFEAGSKAELLVAISHVSSRECLIVCNGYKDEEFIDLGCQALQMGFSCFFVVESTGEVPLILRRAKHWGVRPRIGVRIKLSTEVEGHWAGDSGDRSLFGLGSRQLIDVVDQLRDAGQLDCLEMLHFHLGSQIPSIRNIRDGIAEACRVYLELVREGAPMGFLDLGGGLAVDYDGSASTTVHSRNYDLKEYCVDVVERIQQSLDPFGVPHPTIVTESGRWTVAPLSVLIFNVLEVNRFAPEADAGVTDSAEKLPPSIEALRDVWDQFDNRRIQENHNDALYYRDQARVAFRAGNLSLRQQARAENLCLMILRRIAQQLPDEEYPPASLEQLPDRLAAIYYGNFSVFQSLPDSWAIDQVFPVAPLQRLDERPEVRAVIADLTCDCDGKLDRFPSRDGKANRSLALHEVAPDEHYCLGVFLVGAYQETLGDLHNLFADTNVASVRVTPEGQLRFVHELEGDSIGDVLGYVEFQPHELFKRFRAWAEDSVEEGRISVQQRQQMLQLFGESLRGYTYFES